MLLLVVGDHVSDEPDLCRGLDQLGCGPQDVLHVSSSLRYDLIPAHDLRIASKVFVNRGVRAQTPYYGYHEVTDLSGLPPLLGL